MKFDRFPDGTFAVEFDRLAMGVFVHTFLWLPRVRRRNNHTLFAWAFFAIVWEGK